MTSHLLPPRTLLQIANSFDHDNTFTVLQMNTLARSLCSAASFPHASADALDWDRRKALLVSEITRFSPDIVCLEEIDSDTYDTWFRPQLAARGFLHSLYQKKTNATSIDGVAIFVRDSSFLCMRSSCVPLGTTSQVVVMLELQPRDPRYQNKRLYVAATHFKAKPGNEGIRLGQARDIMAEIHTFVPQMHTEGHLPPHAALIIVGDLNDVPDSTACTYLVTHRSKLKSLYNDQTAPYTTAKRREQLVVRTIDHIFYTPHQLHATHVLSIPPIETAFPQHLPASNYPSDHLAIAGTFEWK